MLVHFPSGLYPFTLILEVMTSFTGDLSFTKAAFYTLLGGLAGSLLAAVFGAIDYFRLGADHPAWKKASWHAMLNLLWIFGFAAILGIKLSNFPHLEPPSTTFLTFLVLLNIGLLFSNHLGGELVFKHGIGTKKPQN